MNALHIQGGIPLQGNVRIQGSKNAALPVLAATLLAGDCSYIENCPQIADVRHMIHLLVELGCQVTRVGDGYAIDSQRAGACNMSGEAITGMRSSLCLLGAMLARFGEVVMEYPGGCVIGARPIDLHIRALEAMGVSFEEEEGRLVGKADKLHGAEIHLPIPSVGATENILLTAVKADGDTVIVGAAREPEIECLCRYLCACGAQIDGIGSSVLRVCAGRLLHGADFVIPADRIVAGTYLFACVGCGGSVLLENAPCNQMSAVIHVAESMGARCQADCDRVKTGSTAYGWSGGLYVQGPRRSIAIPRLRTAVYPGFPTDLQSIALSVLTESNGKSIIEETIFENRFRIVEPLQKMGACIEVLGPDKVSVQGVAGLHGADVVAGELRGGAALVVAALMAEGVSRIEGCAYIERGYENIGKDLRDLGARIVSV